MLRETIIVFKIHFLMSSLKSECMQERHWLQVFQVTAGSKSEEATLVVNFRHLKSIVSNATVSICGTNQ
jgi:hypothetical protein